MRYPRMSTMASGNSSTLSRFLSFLLRHRPDAVGLTMDEQGWVSIDELLEKSAAAGTQLGREEVLRAVETNDKKRFTLSSDRQRIRAAQGHSIRVNLGLPHRRPPASLYHGTATHFLSAILSKGIRPLSRRHVHLSANPETARRSGQRHGNPVVLVVQAIRMYADGFLFYQAENGVWLTDQVPAEYVVAPTSSPADSPTTSRQPKPSK